MIFVRCLFCKQDSSTSRSVEHIIPESLGNTTYILPKGIVCDKCNNYFARKVEQPFLESADILALRFREAIPSKKGIVPCLDGISCNGIPVKVHNPFPGMPLFTGKKEDIIAIDVKTSGIASILKCRKIITPAFTDDIIPRNTTIISRFMAKIALESLAERFRNMDGGLDYLINGSGYDPIRNHARFGNPRHWPCNIRRIYAADKVWQDDIQSPYQVVHESDFLFIPVDESSELLPGNPVEVYPYFIFVMFGLELTIYMIDPDTEGLDPYMRWLKKHGDVSLLYFGKNLSNNT